MGAPASFVSLTEEQKGVAHLRHRDLRGHQHRLPPPPPGARGPLPGPYYAPGPHLPGPMYIQYNTPDDDEVVEKAIPPLTGEQLLLTSPLVKGFSMKSKRWGKSYFSNV